MQPPFAQALGSALFVLFLATRASAQACCTTTGANELGVVDRDRFAVLGAQLDFDRGYGSFDAAGNFGGLQDAEVDDLVLSLGGGIRLWPQALQVNAAFPMRLQYRSFGDQSATHVGPGDASAALRYRLVDGAKPGSGLVPFVEPYAGVRIPTGRSPEEAVEPTLADASGDGAVMAYVGLLLIESLSHDDALKLSGTYGHRFSRDVEGPAGTRRFSPGGEITASFGFAQNLNLFWSWEVFAALRATTTSSYDGVDADDSATHRIRLGGALAHFVKYPTWQLVGGLSFDPPIDGFGSNVPFAGTSLVVSVRRNFGR